MSDRATTNRALKDAAAALAEAGQGQGSVSGTPASQLNQTLVATTFGQTTGAGTSVVHTFSCPAGHSGSYRLSVEGRNTVAGGTAIVGDSFTEDGYAGVTNVAGTPAAIANQAGTPFTSHATSLVGVTVGFTGAAGNVCRITVTDVTGEGTIDWQIKTVLYVN